MKYGLILLLVLGTTFAATLLNFDLDTENTCDEKDEITIVTVTNSANGDPVEDAYIKVEDISPWKQKTTGTADDEGQFEFEGCGDTWNISASYGGYETKTITVTLGACGSCDNPTPPVTPPPQNTTNTSSAPATPPPANSTSGSTTGSTTTTSGTSGSTTPSSPGVNSLPSYPADTSSANSADETDAEEETTKKKPLPCCASSAIIIGLAGMLAIRAKS
jgi:hypothetical protein